MVFLWDFFSIIMSVFQFCVNSYLIDLSRNQSAFVLMKSNLNLTKRRRSFQPNRFGNFSWITIKGSNNH